MTLDLSRTQAHVDPLVGSTFGAYTIVARTGAGRFGSLYRAEDASGAPVTLQVLRTELVGNDAEASAASALNSPGLARFMSAGVLPDCRHVRVFEFLDGQSLQDTLDLKRTFDAAETIEVLSKLLQVLQTTHTWHVTHGRLGLSSVLRVGAQLKLIDFGFAQGAVTPADDLKAVGAIGFTLLTGQEPDGAPPAPGAAVPERLHRLLGELLAGRTESAAAARRELDWLRPTASARKPRRFIVAGLSLAAIAGAAVWATRPEPSPPAPTPTPAPVATPAPEQDAGNTEPEVLDAGSAPVVIEQAPAKEPPRKKLRAETVVTKGPPPTTALLEKAIRVLEGKLRKNKKLKPDEIEEALHVLNKQRLRLSGAVTEDDRRDIATRLAAWKHVWLR